MFGRLMNNYYYGKSGKGDFKKDDLPENRWELFWDTLRTRLSGLCRLNLMYAVVWLPAIIILMMTLMSGISNLNSILAAKDGTLKAQFEETAGQEDAITFTDEQIAELAAVNPADFVQSMVYTLLLLLIPAVAITGPCTAGVAYVVRNWARDEHAFICSDFKDAVKENWKQALLTSAITSVMPMLMYVGWRFYGQMAANQVIMILPQILVIMVGVIWALCVTYMYPLMVTYRLKYRDLIRNSLLLGVARLPMSIGVRLLHCVPVLIGFLLCYLWNPMYGIMITAAYYILIGFSLSRFVTASYTNGVFDKYLNSRIEGAKVNQGLRQPDDDEDEEDDEDEDEKMDGAPEA
ncbi:MAG: YesL family protein [Clostridia bacterium]|nr:YesL family protein [Clostridia bacterium]